MSRRYGGLQCIDRLDLKDVKKWPDPCDQPVMLRACCEGEGQIKGVAVAIWPWGSPGHRILCPVNDLAGAAREH